jgi:hypothetical protein
MSAPGGSLIGGPYRIDLVPQNPTFNFIGNDAVAALPANAPFTLVGDTSNSGQTGLEVTQGWMHVRPAETQHDVPQG